MENIERSLPNKLPDKMQVWTEFGKLAAKYNAVAIFQGSPAFPPPKFLADNMYKAITEGYNQYTFPQGHPLLLKAIADYYSKEFNRNLTTDEIYVSGGANAIMCQTANALTNTGDEILVFEPFFSQYFSHSVFAKAKMRTVPLEYKKNSQGVHEWTFDIELFKSSINEKTKMFIFNNPSNPTGKRFSKEEIQAITDALKPHPQIVIVSDEVYDILVFDEKEHIRFANVDNNWEKTITVFSGGKLFCATGWKIGWGIGPSDIVRKCMIIHESALYNCNVPGQVAIAWSLQDVTKPYKDGKNYLEYSKEQFQKGRDLMNEYLSKSDIPFEVLRSESGYFVMIDVTKCRELIPKKYFKEGFEEDPDTKIDTMKFEKEVPLDYAFSRWLCMERGVSPMPCINFYADDSPYKKDNFVRLAICLTEEKIREAGEKLIKKQ